MRKIFCDRCGKPIEGVTEFGVSTFCRGIDLERMETSGPEHRGAIPATWEYCLDCIKDIENYILHGAETTEKVEEVGEAEETAPPDPSRGKPQKGARLDMGRVMALRRAKPPVVIPKDRRRNRLDIFRGVPGC